MPAPRDLPGQPPSKEKKNIPLRNCDCCKIFNVQPPNFHAHVPGQYQVGYGELTGNHDDTSSDLQLGVASGAYTEDYKGEAGCAVRGERKALAPVSRPPTLDRLSSLRCQHDGKRVLLPARAWLVRKTPWPDCHTRPHSRTGTSKHYNYTYWGFPGALNYTSGKLHSVIVEDLVPGTTYFYRVGDAATQYWSDVRGAGWRVVERAGHLGRGTHDMMDGISVHTTSHNRLLSLSILPPAAGPIRHAHALHSAPSVDEEGSVHVDLLPQVSLPCFCAQEFSFTMPPSAEDGYPFLLGIIGDVGQTPNSSDTFTHLIASQPQACGWRGRGHENFAAAFCTCMRFRGSGEVCHRGRTACMRKRRSWPCHLAQHHAPGGGPGR